MLPEITVKHGTADEFWSGFAKILVQNRLHEQPALRFDIILQAHQVQATTRRAAYIATKPKLIVVDVPDETYWANCSNAVQGLREHLRACTPRPAHKRSGTGAFTIADVLERLSAREILAEQAAQA